MLGLFAYVSIVICLVYYANEQYVASLVYRVKTEPETTYYMDSPSLPMYSDVLTIQLL